MDPATGLIFSTAACLLLSMFCSLFEACLLSAPMSMARMRANEGSAAWTRILRLKENPDRPIAGILITNTIANTAGAALAGYFAEGVFQSWGAAVFMAALVLCILYFSEIIPKTVGVIFATQLAPIVAFPIRGLIVLWWPLIWLIEFSTGLIKRRASDTPTLTEMELASLAKQVAAEGEIYRHEAQLIERVLKLDEVKVRDLMTPRTVVYMLPDRLPLSRAKTDALHWKHSRLPVYRADNLDDVFGVCLRREVFDALARGVPEDKTIADFARKLTYIPEGASAHQALDQFINSHEHIFGVVDEYGTFLGILTLEDVIECLLGREIVDEFDVHADMQIYAREQARKRGLPVEDEKEADRDPETGITNMEE